MSTDRLNKVCTLMQEQKIQAAAINAGPDLKYFTGLDFHLSERPAILLISDKGKSAFVFPEFEKDKAAESTIPLAIFPYPEDAKLWPGVAGKALEELKITKAPVAVNPVAMRFLEMDLLQNASADLQIISGEAIFQDVYIQKDAQEIDDMRKAVKIAQDALLATIPHIKPGKTEKEIANLLVINLLNAGSEPELAFSPIIAAGPNSANPHANPSDRKLQAGDMLIIDWGARFNGYVSDITRTFALEYLPEEFGELAKIVLEANQTARALAAPGVIAKDVDAAARTVISQAGYGENFLHRTGHGIGLNAHEEPYITSFSSTELHAGMTFTIEPGIYLTGKGGIRIEDNIAITANGAETLTSLPREIQII